MASSRPPPSKLFDLDITIVSAKHLKNVNWRHGDLKPYVIFWLDPDRRLATKPDDSGSTRPVWNEHFNLPINQSLHDSLLTLEIFHSKPSETPKPLVGTLRFPLKDLIDSDDSSTIRTLELRRPSGRPQGKIRIKLAVRERPAPPTPDYHITPPPSYYYSSAPPPPPPRDYSRGYSPSPYTTSIPPPAPAPAPPSSASPYPYGGYSDPYSGYYSGYYSQPPLPPRPFFDRTSSYGGPSGPSAPVDFSSYDQKQKGSKMGLGTGLAVGAVAGVLGGLALEEGLKYEEEKIAERVENDIAARDDYSDYRSDY
ncbi:C2 calcium-dependent membrane targeting [Macleaya cordata]|uniref:C2 calcium-dependent membrane targeting n=1 Tax=Macleaya cordata TaxID=56857 RepID=A0A200R4L2_MACCD|nr:C2 calcium-dependent membrane targeting [Macleaya cordata]